jgi:beta-N-acetylhexosaminidase
MNSRAFITGISGLELSAVEREFTRHERPWGFILFKRNIATPAQVSSLVRELRDSINSPDAPVLIDQEGGRVARLGPPHWPVYPPGAVFGALYDIDPELGFAAARLSSRLIAADLIDLGITVDCLPLADVPVEGSDAVIGNRAYGTEPGKVAAIALAITEGLEQGGVLPILKHIPGRKGHSGQPFSVADGRCIAGRAGSTDFAAFNRWRMSMAMTAHVVFSALDPVHPATTSATIISNDRGVISSGFVDGDDVSRTCVGGIDRRADPSDVNAGCDWFCIATASRRDARRRV